MFKKVVTGFCLLAGLSGVATGTSVSKVYEFSGLAQAFFDGVFHGVSDLEKRAQDLLSFVLNSKDKNFSPTYLTKFGVSVSFLDPVRCSDAFRVKALNKFLNYLKKESFETSDTLLFKQEKRLLSFLLYFLIPKSWSNEKSLVDLKDKLFGSYRRVMQIDDFCRCLMTLKRDFSEDDYRGSNSLGTVVSVSPSENKECSVCTLGNAINATVCIACETPFTDIPLATVPLNPTPSITPPPAPPSGDPAVPPVPLVTKPTVAPVPTVSDPTSQKSPKTESIIAANETDTSSYWQEVGVGATSALAAAVLTRLFVRAVIQQLRAQKATLAAHGRDTKVISARIKSLMESEILKISGVAIGAGLLAGSATAFARRRSKE
jgi:hypothetical protein